MIKTSIREDMEVLTKKVQSLHNKQLLLRADQGIASAKEVRFTVSCLYF